MRWFRRKSYFNEFADKVEVAFSEAFKKEKEASNKLHRESISGYKDVNPKTGGVIATVSERAAEKYNNEIKAASKKLAEDLKIVVSYLEK